MSGSDVQPPMDAQQVLDSLRALRGAPQDAAFWNRLAVCLTLLCRARGVMLLRGRAGAPWQVLGASAPADSLLATQTAQLLAELAPRALAQGQAQAPQASGDVVAAVRLFAAEGPTLALMQIGARERSGLNEWLLRAQLVADVPAAPAAALATTADSGPGTALAAPSPQLVGLLDLVARVMQESEFGAAALALVNLLAVEADCDQVVLGVHEGHGARVLAISHIDRFERNAEQVQLLEAALDEAFDQGVDIVYPPPAAPATADQAAGDANADAAAAAIDTGVVTLCHDRLARSVGHGHLVTLLLDGGEPEAPRLALLLGRRDSPLAAERLQQISVALHLLRPWLADRREQSLGRWQRGALQARRRLREWTQPGRSGRLWLGGAAVLLLLALALGRWPYRIEATAELTTDRIQVISAPFDGYLGQVPATLGDVVTEGAVLARLDTRELQLQSTDLAAELARYQAEADRTRALGQTAETQVAMARAVQAQARLQRVQLQLAQASVAAPFAGVIVEGERKELAGAPVRQGDKLFRLARVEGLYAVIHVPERDMRELPAQARGALRLLGQPGSDIGFTVEAVVPVAQVRGTAGSQFALKVKLDRAAEPWWRPGMSGLALVEAGDRPILWIWTHRLIDQLRLWLWW
ncbi:MAG: efflux RND transporter periplasmic adaptor subunit [Burkholderiaceae bacterium]|nr:efflux RND transporter periplasmic adaptor subunit [Burkholderiaceae bacterium]